jgi:hypothetical protein
MSWVPLQETLSLFLEVLLSSYGKYMVGNAIKMYITTNAQGRSCSLFVNEASPPSFGAP